MPLRDVCTMSIACRGQNREFASWVFFVRRLLTLGQNREFASWVFFVRRLLTLRPSTLRGLKGKRVFSDILVWRRWVWLASALLGHSMRHRWQLWFVQTLASRDQNRQLAIWVCLVRRLLNWRPPTRRGMKGKRVISPADVPLWRRWTLFAAALLGCESALHRFTRSECLLLGRFR